MYDPCETGTPILRSLDGNESLTIYSDEILGTPFNKRCSSDLEDIYFSYPVSTNLYNAIIKDIAPGSSGPGEEVYAGRHGMYSNGDIKFTGEFINHFHCKCNSFTSSS